MSEERSPDSPASNESEPTSADWRQVRFRTNEYSPTFAIRRAQFPEADKVCDLHYAISASHDRKLRCYEVVVAIDGKPVAVRIPYTLLDDAFDPEG